jgi:hypothetical protein
MVVSHSGPTLLVAKPAGVGPRKYDDASINHRLELRRSVPLLRISDQHPSRSDNNHATIPRDSVGHSWQRRGTEIHKSPVK